MDRNSERDQLVMRQVTSGELAGVPDRATRVASWVGWHFFELAGVTVPAGVAVVVSPWAWVVSAVVGAGWTVHEVRTTRAQAAITAGRDRPAVATVPAETPEADDHDDIDADVAGVSTVVKGQTNHG